jgi:ubiquinone/menaquinone biosynthesis C-methylase UbiE
MIWLGFRSPTGSRPSGFKDRGVEPFPGATAIPTEAAYDLAAPFYDDWKWQEFWRSCEAPFVLKRLKSAAAAGASSLLDVGCGTGWYLGELRADFARLVGIDQSEGMLEIARGRVPAAELLKADLESIIFERPMFDAVLCARVLPHIPDLDAAAEKLASALNPGGVLVLSSIAFGEGTSLPRGETKLTLLTHGHTRAAVDEAFESQGLVLRESVGIGADGRFKSIPSAAWISVWTKPVSASGRAFRPGSGKRSWRLVPAYS